MIPLSFCVCGYEVAIDIPEPGHVTPSTPPHCHRKMGRRGLARALLLIQTPGRMPKNESYLFEAVHGIALLVAT
jgi:hypothetical protein